MKTGLGLHHKIRVVYAYYNLFRFWWRKVFLGFDVANQFIQSLDKVSLQLVLIKNGAIIGKNCDIETGIIFHNCNNYSNLIMGNNCHIGKNCFFDLRDKVTIGDNVVISMKCTFITHLDMSKSKLSKHYPVLSNEIKIGDNCYFGVGSTILKDVVIGNNSLIAAGSLVSKSVAENIKVGGIPAKEIDKISRT